MALSASESLAVIIMTSGGGPAAVGSSDFWQNVLGNLASGSLPAGNQIADPSFINPLAGDFHLLPGSPCIDAAYTATFFHNRTVNNTVQQSSTGLPDGFGVQAQLDGAGHALFCESIVSDVFEAHAFGKTIKLHQ